MPPTLALAVLFLFLTGFACGQSNNVEERDPAGDSDDDPWSSPRSPLPSPTTPLNVTASRAVA